MIFSDEIITSRQNSRIVGLCKLSDRGEREKTGRFRFDGIKLLYEAYRRGVEIDTVYIRKSSWEGLKAKAKDLYGWDMETLSCHAVTVENTLFDRISEEKAPEGVITVAKALDKYHKNAIINIEENREAFLGFLPAGHLVIADSVRDPANMGAIIRSASAFGISGLIVSRDCADIYNGKTVRGSMGTLFDMPIFRVDEIAPTIRLLRESGRRVYAAALGQNAVTLDKMIWEPSDCVVIGNEGHGLGQEVIEASDAPLYIPMRGGAESLNASVAAAVIMWEIGK